MLLYHGSQAVVEKPDLLKCRPRNDYGQAFYCTQSRKLACEWACPDLSANGFVNCYSLDESGLAALDLDEHEDGVLVWIAVLFANRPLDREWNTAVDVERLIKNFGVDLSRYDIVSGHRADDSYFSIARAFASGAITDLQLAEALRLGGLGRQVALRSQKALDALVFEGAERVSAATYAPSRAVRDSQARHAFQALKQTGGDAAGKRIYELGR